MGLPYHAHDNHLLSLYHFFFVHVSLAYHLPPCSFFNEVLGIGEHGYVPMETGVLRTRQKSIGIIEAHFNIGQLS